MQLALEESASPDDEVVEVDDLKLLISERDAPYFNNQKLDYTKSLFGYGHYQLISV